MITDDVTKISISSTKAASHKLIRAFPYLLALLFAFWGLRGIGCNNVVETDSARHAMNGAFIYDLIRNGQLASPIAYGKFYYGHLPALSLPYHPPLFPIIESLFFWGFGANVLAARLAVAFCVGLSVLLFYRLLRSTHGSYVLAISATITFFAMRLSQRMANGVWLEFPSLVFVLGALYCLRDLDKEYSLRRGMAFAILAGAAVWTKQHTLFLGLVPFFYVFLSRHWQLLKQKTIWISSAIFCVFVLALLALSFPFQGTGALQGLTFYKFSADAAGKIAIDYFARYLNGILREFGVIPTILGAFAIIGCLLISKIRKFLKASNELYLAWAFAAFLILLITWHATDRYLFYMFPPIIFFGYVILYRICVSFLSRFSPAKYLLIFIATFYLVFHITLSHSFLYGPSQAASHVITGLPTRILYSGQTDGSFIFAVRSLDPDLKTVVIRGEKLPASTFAADELERFAHRFGIHYIVLEQATWDRYSRFARTTTSAWSQLITTPSPSMVLERVLPMSSSMKQFNGKLYIYRFTNPSPTPENILTIHLGLVGDAFDMEFRQN